MALRKPKIEGPFPSHPLYDRGLAEWLVTLRFHASPGDSKLEGDWANPDPKAQAELARQHWTGSINMNGALKYCFGRASDFDPGLVAKWMAYGVFPIDQQTTEGCSEWDRWEAVRLLAATGHKIQLAYFDGGEYRPSDAIINAYFAEKKITSPSAADAVDAQQQWDQCMVNTTKGLMAKAKQPVTGIAIIEKTTAVVRDKQRAEPLGASIYDKRPLLGVTRSCLYAGGPDGTTLWHAWRNRQLLWAPVTGNRLKNPVFNTNPGESPEFLELLMQDCKRSSLICDLLFYCPDQASGDKLTGLGDLLAKGGN